MSVQDIITPSWLKERFLYGVDLTDDLGNPFPDTLYQQSIDAAVSTLESDLDIVLNGTHTFVERRDTNDWHTESFFLMGLDHRPILSVDKLEVQFGKYPSVPLPRTWLHVSSSKAGQIQVLPGPEGIGSIIFGGQAPFLGLAGLYGRPYTPLWFRISYTVGFEYDLSGTVAFTNGSATVSGTNTFFIDPYSDEEFEKKYGSSYGGGVMPRLVPGSHVVMFNADNSVREVVRVKRVSNDTSFECDTTFDKSVSGLSAKLLMYPPSMLDCVGLVASMLPLDTAGDLIVGAGIASKSISMDGLSTSVNTTASSTNAGYGARMLSYKNRLKDTIKTIKRDYRIPNMAVF